MEVAASTEDDEIRCSGLAKRPEKNAKILPRGSLFVAGAPRRSHAGAQPQAPLRLTGPAPSAVERPPRSARSRAPLGGNWAALAPQASVHSRHGWAVVHAEKMCPTGRVRSHCAAERSAGATTRSLEVVPGAAVREFSCIAETCWLPSLCSLLHCGCRRYPRRAGAACLRASKWLQCLGCPPGPGVAGMWGRGVAALRRPAPAALVPARRMSSRSAFQLPWESKPQEISKVRAYSAAQNFPVAEHRDPLNVPRRSTGAQVVAADHPGQLQ